MVILPLEEYEALIDQAFGPGEGVGSRQLAVGGGRGQERGWEAKEEEADPYIELSEEVIAEVDEMAAETPDEADIDEEALKSLWQAPEEAPQTKDADKIAEKPQEVAKKKSSRDEGGEEEFYLEQID